MPVVAFDLRICLGACIVCLELLAKYLIRGPSVGGSLRTSSPVVSVCPRLHASGPFFLCFFVLFFSFVKKGQKTSGVSREQQPRGGKKYEPITRLTPP